MSATHERLAASEAGRADGRVAVVMITHNRKDEALKSLGEMSRLPEQPRIVVVDNASVDGTAEAVVALFPSIEVVRLARNLGSAARTIGTRRVDAPYVAFCDDDSWWEPGCLRRAADLLDAHPRLALVAARVLIGPENRLDPVCDAMARSPLPREPGMPGPSLLGFLACAIVVRRLAFLEAGGFDGRFLVGGEEALLAADLAARGGWLCYIPELIVHHHPSRIRDPAGRRATMARNALWFAWMRRPWRIALRETFAAVSRPPGRAAGWRTLYAALGGLPWALRHRHALPETVERGLRQLEEES